MVFSRSWSGSARCDLPVRGDRWPAKALHESDLEGLAIAEALAQLPRLDYQRAVMTKWPWAGRGTPYGI